DLGPDRQLHTQVAEVDHLDPGVEVTGPRVLEAEAARRRDAAARGDGVRDLHVWLDGRAGDVALHADDAAHFDFPREAAHRELAHEARARDRHVHLDRPAAGELEIEGGIELLAHGRGHAWAPLRAAD